ncbi:hypothetical protein JQ554_17335 [Bradyrhizobium diazoefficiens]|nr:hypothetical protein [Bradyrhizobium diazoefficiens]MBR1006421.1 hypothetical protein [Bradyrhizobium diazoefficiens]MBR1015236.1 hypothetical protein [Bradyrhizobium diazoefficiens]MBR1052909.1 hypothetical protein [Bradyrhizobium diazoefficiens]MBR1059394.1 hypothetical protein [Bradyrhizobium diazoefficiens]
MLVGDGNVHRQRASAQQHGHAACRVKLPEIWPEPPVIGSRITGAEITLPSRTMTKGFPVYSPVTSAKRRVPRQGAGEQLCRQFLVPRLRDEVQSARRGLRPARLARCSP